MFEKIWKTPALYKDCALGVSFLKTDNTLLFLLFLKLFFIRLTIICFLLQKLIVNFLCSHLWKDQKQVIMFEFSQITLFDILLQNLYCTLNIHMHLICNNQPHFVLGQSSYIENIWQVSNATGSFKTLEEAALNWSYIIF